jgi:hypothetical protein
MPRYFISMYTDGPSACWNVIDRQTQEWVLRFQTKEAAEAYAVRLERNMPALSTVSQADRSEG